MKLLHVLYLQYTVQFVLYRQASYTWKIKHSENNLEMFVCFRKSALCSAPLNEQSQGTRINSLKFDIHDLRAMAFDLVSDIQDSN